MHPGRGEAPGRIGFRHGNVLYRHPVQEPDHPQETRTEASLREDKGEEDLVWDRVRRPVMPKSLNILPNPALKPEVTACALLEGNLEEWIACCSQRFFPLARRIAGDNSLAEDALQVSWIKILQSINHAYFDGPKACPWVSQIVANTARM